MMLIVFCTIILTVAINCAAEIIQFKNHVMQPLQPEFWTLYKYAKSDVPNWLPGNGRSYVDLSGLKFNTKCGTESIFSTTSTTGKCQNSSVDFLIFQELDGQDWANYWPAGQFCCTNELIVSGDCSNEGRLIYPSSLPGALYKTLPISSDPLSPTFLASEDVVYHHEIEMTGVYILMVATCHSDGPIVVLNGKIESLDPYGYLPADIFANMPFYEILSCFYSLLALIWIALCLWNSHELIVLQYWITSVLAFGLLETAMEYGYYLNWNDTGYQHVGITIAGTLFGVIKRTLSRIVLQFVALGYGIVRPTLGDDMMRVLLLGLIYFILSLIYTLATKFQTNAATMSDPEYNFISLVILMLAGLDTTFYIWIITSINNLLTTLAARKLVYKYLLYRNFRYVLFVSLFCTFIWVVYGSIETMNDGYGEDSNWKYKWTIDALWEMTYFVLFLIVCILWAPYKNNHRYAYSYEMVNLNDDEEWQAANNNIVDESIQSAGDSIGHNENGNADLALPSTKHHTPLIKKKYILEGDDEVGGSTGLHEDPFQGMGALDANAAVAKKN